MWDHVLMDTQSELKKITDVNLETLSKQFAAVLTEHFGGELEVNLTKFEQIEYTGGGLAGFGDRIVIELNVTDRSRVIRTMSHHEPSDFVKA
jgi:hypothetical protein